MTTKRIEVSVNLGLTEDPSDGTMVLVVGNAEPVTCVKFTLEKAEEFLGGLTKQVEAMRQKHKSSLIHVPGGIVLPNGGLT